MLTAHFSEREFGPFPMAVRPNLVKLCTQLEVLRAELGRPIIITPHGGWRSLETNSVLGGAPDSQHLYGRAADIYVHGMSAGAVRLVLLDLIMRDRMDDGGIGSYARWVHYDVRGHRMRWSG